MFRRLSGTEPEDPTFPADLERLGYFIKDADQVRQLKDPTKCFHFWISKNERVNEAQREAFNTCIRTIIQTRLLGRGWPSLCQVRLPLSAQPTQPHVPIWISANIKTAQRVIVFFGETHQDHGIFAWRLIEESVSSGSIIGFVKDAQGESSDNTAILIANMGQLLWYRGGGRAVTLQTWNALPRAKGTDPPMLIDEARNRVPGNETPAQHVKSIFEDVLPRFTKPDARIQVLGTGDGAAEVVAYLEDTWEEWAGKVTAIAVTTGPVWIGREVEKENFKAFWGQRARAYVVSDEPVETPLTGQEDFGCNVYSAGENAHVECTTPKAYQKILQFFKLVEDVPGYIEVEAVPLLLQTATDTSFKVTSEDQIWS